MRANVELNDNQKIISSLNHQRGGLSKVEIDLIFLNEDEKANEVSRKEKLLARKIRKLLAKQMAEWDVDKDEIISELNETNAGIDDAIEHIKKNVKTAEKFVKLLEQADKAIDIATEILKKSRKNGK